MGDLAGLFTPMTVNEVLLQNRFVMAPMTRGFAQAGVPSGRSVEYYARRARGGVGLIITEGAAICPGACLVEQGIPAFYGEAALTQWGHIAQAVHQEGGRIMVQLWHTGLLRAMGRTRNDPTLLGPSGHFPVDGGAVAGTAMSQSDIDATIEAYAAAAAAAQRLGFDGVQLHGAHGYLIDQFFWSETNNRTDRYGGDVAERTRFCVEIVQEMRRRVGPFFPIGLRFSQWKLPGNYDIRPMTTASELERFLIPLADSGIDFFDCSTRRYWEPAYPGTDLTLAGWTKKLTSLTTVTVGSVGLSGPLTTGPGGHPSASPDTDFTALIRMFERGDFDLVAIGRALLANPAWPKRVRDGVFGALRAYSLHTKSVLH
jgi:2,4-dienoyl-CoA reductase-like NADH-dependent reductase (Old Yellow Enzyme family)